MADSYRKLLEKDKIDKETAEKEIRIYDFLSTCDSDDICRLVNSAAFNDIIKAYCKQALKDAEVDEETINSVMNQFTIYLIPYPPKKHWSDYKDKLLLFRPL